MFASLPKPSRAEQYEGEHNNNSGTSKSQQSPCNRQQLEGYTLLAAQKGFWPQPMQRCHPCSQPSHSFTN